MTELSDLVGEHILTGVDRLNKQIERYGSLEYSAVLNFTLDGVTYSVVEDPDDGYRSSARDLVVSDTPTSNTFQGVRVLGIMRTPRREHDILDLYDIANGKLVLSAGTENTDDYYPCFVAEWTPENLSVNEPANKDY